MTYSSALTIGVLFAGTLLSSCSQSSPTTESGAGSSAPTVAAERTTGTKVDSLNGVPGHQFGESLSAFPGLELTPGQGEPGTRRYAYPDNKPEAGWFGKHKKQFGYVFYTFKDDKFMSFQAIAFGTGRPLLQQEAQFLFGQGKRNGIGTRWGGKKQRLTTR